MQGFRLVRDAAQGLTRRFPARLKLKGLETYRFCAHRCAQARFSSPRLAIRGLRVFWLDYLGRTPLRFQPHLAVMLIVGTYTP